MQCRERWRSMSSYVALLIAEAADNFRGLQSRYRAAFLFQHCLRGLSKVFTTFHDLWQRGCEIKILEAPSSRGGERERISLERNTQENTSCFPEPPRLLTLPPFQRKGPESGETYRNRVRYFVHCLFRIASRPAYCLDHLRERCSWSQSWTTDLLRLARLVSSWLPLFRISVWL